MEFFNKKFFFRFDGVVFFFSVHTTIIFTSSHTQRYISDNETGTTHKGSRRWSCDSLWETCRFRDTTRNPGLLKKPPRSFHFSPTCSVYENQAPSTRRHMAWTFSVSATSSGVLVMSEVCDVWGRAHPGWLARKYASFIPRHSSVMLGLGKC